MTDFKYKAFISYSHKDRQWGNWLHRKLETYRLPKYVVGKDTAKGPVPRRLRPIFRDREELSASHDLGADIEAALEGSENLIVICSPQAAKSHWVNQEILYFKRHNRGAQVFALVVEGEPFGSNRPATETQECLPPALRYQLDDDGALSKLAAEPLCADVQPSADGKNLGFLKLISGMVGVGLDEIVQRDMQRARRRVTAITAGSLTAVLLMGALTVFALDARREAEDRRQEIEDVMDFMIGDLKDKLEPVGRLDVMQGVASEVSEYYERQSTSSLSCQDFSKWARALHLSANVSRGNGQSENYITSADKALSLTSKKLSECWEENELILAHSHSHFWKAYTLRDEGNVTRSYAEFTEYLKYTHELLEREQLNWNYYKEVGDAYTSRASVRFKPGTPEANNAIKDAIEANKYYQKALSLNPDHAGTLGHLANNYGWIAEKMLAESNFEKAVENRELEFETFKLSAKQETSNPWQTMFGMGVSKRSLGRVHMLNSKIEEAKTSVDEAIPYFEGLVSHDASNGTWRLGLAMTYAMKSEIEGMIGNPDEQSKYRKLWEDQFSLLPAFAQKPYPEFIDLMKIHPNKEN